MTKEFDALFAEHQKLLGELQAMRAVAKPEQEPWRESASDYERGVIDGRQMQMQSSVDKAVNRMAQPDQDEVDIRSRLYQRIHELETQLAQPEQTNTRPYYTIDELNAWADEKEKQAWRNAAIRIGEELSSVGPDDYYDMDAWKWLDWAMEQKPRGKNSLAKPEQKPVAYINIEERKLEWAYKYMSWDTPTVINLPKIPLYTTPPQRTWVGLTDDEIKQGESKEELGHGFIQGALWAQDKLKEKNT